MSTIGRIVVHGVGREGMIKKGLAMRPFHVDLSRSYVGEMTTPSIGSRDLLIVSTGPGGLCIIDAICRCTEESGAKVQLLLTQPVGSTSQFAHVVALVPAQTMVDDQGSYDSCFILPMGSLYEGALFVLFEMVILRLTSALGQTTKTMQSKHHNLK
eukprot:Gb_41778 [translate_table: standard]